MRAYGGGEYLFGINPADFDPGGLHVGLEYRSREPLVGPTRVFAAADLKSWQEHDWKINASVAAGFEYESSALEGRLVRFVIEVYDGFNPYGQFYDQEIVYIGAGFRFGF